MTPPYEDLAALRRDARLLDRLAAGNEMVLDRDEDPLVDLLASLRDEARQPLPELVLVPPAPVSQMRPAGGAGGARSGRRSRRAAAGAVAALVSLSLTGVAAAVGGDAILAPIRAVIAQVVGDQAPSADTVAVSDKVEDLLAQARAAVAAGDQEGAAALLEQARALAVGLDTADAAQVVADLTADIGAVQEQVQGDTAAGDAGAGGTVASGGSSAATGGGSGSATGGSGAATAGAGSGPAREAVPPGQPVAPGQSGPPGQSGQPGQASAPGQSSPPGSQVEPPRTVPEKGRDERSSGKDVDSDDDDRDSPRPPATSGSSGASSQGRGAPAGGNPGGGDAEGENPGRGTGSGKGDD